MATSTPSVARTSTPSVARSHHDVRAQHGVGCRQGGRECRREEKAEEGEEGEEEDVFGGGGRGEERSAGVRPDTDSPGAHVLDCSSSLLLAPGAHNRYSAMM